MMNLKKLYQKLKNKKVNFKMKIIHKLSFYSLIKNRKIALQILKSPSDIALIIWTNS